MLKRGETILTDPGNDEHLHAGDEPVVVGADPAIDAFAAPDTDRSRERRDDRGQ